MKLNDILKGLEVLSATADMAQEITGVSYDSRTTAPGSVFVAISGGGRPPVHPHSGGKGRRVCGV